MTLVFRLLLLLLLFDQCLSQFERTRNRSECYFFECDGSGMPGIFNPRDVRREAAAIASRPQSQRSQSQSVGLVGGFQHIFSPLVSDFKDLKQQVGCTMSTRRELGSALARLELLTDGFVRQKDAVNEVRNAVRKHLISGGPTVLHLVGNNGVGKSYLAKLVSLALDMAPHPSLHAAAGSALLELNLMQKVNSEKHHTLVEDILSFLQRRPDGVVLLDDLQYLGDRHDIIDAISSLFATQEFLGTDMSQAMFILTSNYGANFALPEAQSSSAQLQRVFYSHLGLFRNHAITEIPHLIILPAYDEDGFAEMAATKLSNLFCDAVVAEHVGPHTPYLEYDSRVPHLLATIAWTDGRRQRMGRIVEDTLNYQIVGPLIEQFESENKLPLKANQVIRITVDDSAVSPFRFSLVTVSKTGQTEKENN